MSHPLENRLKRIRRQVRQVLWLYGMSWIVVVLFATVLCVGTLDWLVQLDDSGLRLILELSIFVGAGWIAWRYLITPLLVSLSDIDIAQKIEKRYPGFKDSFSSTVQFVEQNTDPKLGSSDLQNSVIEKTLAQVDQIDISDVIQTREVLRIAAAAVFVCMVTAMIVGMNQMEAATALHRLVFPFSSKPWPKKTQLRLVNDRLEILDRDPDDPLRIARGDTLEVFVDNINGPLPNKLMLEYRFEDEQELSEPLRKTTLRDHEGHLREVGAATLVVTKGPMAFRAVGGDDFEMRWHQLQVVPPPVVENMKLTLTPPNYTGKGIEILPKGVGHIEGLVGTKVHISADVNKRLGSATLQLKETEPVTIELSREGLHFQISFVIREPGISSYWFALKDQQGFENSKAPRYEIRGIADQTPTIYIDQPATDVQLTTEAELPLRIVAKDDLGLRSIRLQYKISGSEEQASVTIPLFNGDDRPDQRVVSHIWNLAALQLAVGTRVVFHAEATDDFDLDGTHVGRSILRTITIVSTETKRAEIAAQQAEILDEFDRALKIQQQAREQVKELQLQLEKVGQLRPDDIDLLKRVELDQQHISARLMNPVDGVETRTEQLLEELKSNKIKDVETSQRLNRIAGEMSILRTEHLPAIERDLTHSRKSAISRGATSAKSSPEKTPPKKQSDKSKNDRTTADNEIDQRISETNSLARAEENQQAVIESLTAMRQLLSRWRNHRNLTGDFREIVENQTELKKETAEIGKSMLARPDTDATPQEKADLAKLKERQQSEAERLEEFRRKLGQAADFAEGDSTATDPLLETLEELKQRATSGKMREVAERLGRKNSLGQALKGQAQILEELNELSDILEGKSVTDTEMLVKKLRQAESELSLLKKRQEELLRKVQQAKKIPEKDKQNQELQKLTKQQRQLRQEVSSMARRLRRLKARRSGSSAQRAAAQMQQAESNLKTNPAGPIDEKQQEALDDLEQAQRELAQKRRTAEEQLAREQLEKIADELKGMIARQQNVIDETVRLDTEYKKRGNWSRGQLKSLARWTDVQRTLQKETDELIETLKSAEVFALALRGASRSMAKAAERLSLRKTDKVTVTIEQAAKQRFVDLIAALKSENSKGGNQPQEGTAAKEGAGPQTDGIPQLAQLKMLKTLQEDINGRTTELDATRIKNGVLSKDELQELEQLAGEQGELADLARNLMEAVVQPFKTEPEQDESPVKEKK